jgi:hypothetical protein
MSDLMMDLETNDLEITDGDLSIVDGTAAITQDLQQTLQVWLGEWFLDTTVGVPYRQQILVKNPNMDIVQADLINAAAAVYGVEQILDSSFEYDNSNRSLSVEIVAMDSNGQTIQAQTQIGTPLNGTIEGTPT